MGLRFHEKRTSLADQRPESTVDWAGTYFIERAARADLTAFEQLMQRKTSEPPHEGDQI